MNKSQIINTQAELEQLIDRYFEGETSLQEEQTLRQLLADCPWSSEKIDEALVVMGYFMAHRKQRRTVTAASTRQFITGIAASIALVLAVGGYALWHQHGTTSDMCIAYVNGEVIQNDDKVMEMIANDMSVMDNAADGMADQLSSLGEALEIDNQ